MGELARVLKERGRDIAASPVSPAQLAGLLALDRQGHDQRRDREGRLREDVRLRPRRRRASSPAEGLTQIDDEAQIVALIGDVLADNADAVAGYRAGKTATFGFLVGR